mmetsp:Transcript_36245/g.26898  ORF Transcript_36245/g.26898 Transcript_36245/m.26898 type:complete len:142 (+) Transcript_36245:36-461(+)
MSESEESKGETTLFVSPIAEPLASEKLQKKLLKITKKALKGKMVRRGVKETVKAIRKDQKGFCVIAADISPIDVLSHLPILCEEKGIPYIYVKSRAEIGDACKTKRPTSCVFIGKPGSKDELKTKFSECEKLIKARNPYLE